MARHSRHRSVEDDYPPYDEPRGSAGPWDPYPPRQEERAADPYRRRSEASYHDDRWASRDRDDERYRRREPALSRDPPLSREPPSSRDPRNPRGHREPREPRGASEMRFNRRPYDHSPEPPTHSRRGRSEAPSRPSAYDTGRPSSRDPHARRGSRAPAEWGYGGHQSSKEASHRNHSAERHGHSRGFSQDRDLSARYPPRSADTRRGRYHPGSGAAPPTFIRWQDEQDDARFAAPGRARTHPAHLQQQHPSRGSPPPRGRSRNYSPDPYYAGTGPVPRSRSAGRPPVRAASVPASRQPQPAPRTSRSQDRGRSRSRSRSRGEKTKSRAQKAASYAAMGAAARVALQAGAQAAYKLRDDPSPWVGEKGVRVASAALGAGIVDGIVGSRHPKMRRGGMRHQAMREATEFGLKQFVVQPMATRGAATRSKSRTKKH